MRLQIESDSFLHFLGKNESEVREAYNQHRVRETKVAGWIVDHCGRKFYICFFPVVVASLYDALRLAD